MALSPQSRVQSAIDREREPRWFLKRQIGNRFGATPPIRYRQDQLCVGSSFEAYGANVSWRSSGKRAEMKEAAKWAASWRDGRSA
jgi:hypothetical protein